MQTKKCTKDLFEFDKAANLVVAGVDEVGRGPLAGPLVCACVVMPLTNIIDSINDSKILNKKTREKLYQQIIDTAIDYNIQVVDNLTIDQINILQATKHAMTNCIKNMKTQFDIVFVDYVKLDIANSKSITHGDSISYNIAAASILAKVTRDRLMQLEHIKYPQYSFDTNVGYGTKTHIQAIKKFGLTPIHRRTFVKNFVSNDTSLSKNTE